MAIKGDPLSSVWLHARKRHQRVALGPGDVRLEPVDRRRGVACAAGLEYLAVIAPRKGDVQKGALVGVRAEELVAAGALFSHGRGLEKILDIAATLEPVAGRFAVSLFMVGVLAAGLSSVFPIMMVAPLLIGDWKDGRMETDTNLFRVICLVAALWGLVVPMLGSNPVTVTVAVQVSNVFVLPLAVGAILFLVNRRSVMGEYHAGWLMNALLSAALVFSLAVAATGVMALRRLAQS